MTRAVVGNVTTINLNETELKALSSLMQKPDKRKEPDAYKLWQLRMILSESVVQELEAVTNERELNAVILSSTKNIHQAVDEMEDNEKYQKAKLEAKIAAQPKKDFEDGLKEVKKYQNAKIAYARYLLSARGYE